MRWGTDIVSHTPLGVFPALSPLPPAFGADLSPTCGECPALQIRATFQKSRRDAGQAAQMEGASSMGESPGKEGKGWGGKCVGPVCGPELWVPLSGSSHFHSCCCPPPASCLSLATPPPSSAAQPQPQLPSSLDWIASL